MNYRHAFHAGNFADAVKHALLVWLLGALARKPAPFRVLDTHAGRGRYALDAPEATRTGEWQGGIGRLRGIAEGPLAPYLALAGAEAGAAGALSRAQVREQIFIRRLTAFAESYLAELRADATIRYQ